MEQEPPPTSRKLIDILKAEYPDASEVRVSFPDKWEFIETVKHEHGPIYVAGFPIERAFIGREHFEGLGPETNVNLVFYRLYKFFQPWPLPLSKFANFPKVNVLSTRRTDTFLCGEC